MCERTCDLGLWLMAAKCFNQEFAACSIMATQLLVGSLHFFVLDCFFHISSFCKKLNQNTASFFPFFKLCKYVICIYDCIISDFVSNIRTEQLKCSISLITPVKTRTETNVRAKTVIQG